METVDVVTLIASVPAIVAIVNLLKKSGLPDAWSPLAAIVVGVGLNVTVWAWGDLAVFETVARGLIFALAASGLYDLTPGQAQPKIVLPQNAVWPVSLETTSKTTDPTTPEGV